MLKLSNEMCGWLASFKILPAEHLTTAHKNDYTPLTQEVTHKFVQGSLLLNLTNRICKAKTMNSLIQPLTRFNNTDTRKTRIINFQMLQKQLNKMGVFISDKKRQAMVEGDLRVLSYILEKLFELFGQTKTQKVQNMKKTGYNSNNLSRAEKLKIKLPKLAQQSSEDMKNGSDQKNAIEKLKNNLSRKSICISSAKKVKGNMNKTNTNNMFLNPGTNENSLEQVPLDQVQYSETEKDQYGLAILKLNQNKFDLYVQTNNGNEESQKLFKISEKHINKSYLLANGGYANYKPVKRNKDPETTQNMLEVLLLILSKIFNIKPFKCISFFVDDNRQIKEICNNGEDGYGFERLTTFFDEINKLIPKIADLLLINNTHNNITMLLEMSRNAFKSRDMTLAKAALRAMLSLVKEFKKREKLFYVQVYLETHPDFIKDLVYLSQKDVEAEKLVFELAGFACNKLFKFGKFFEKLKLTTNRAEELQFHLQFLDFLTEKEEKMADEDIAVDEEEVAAVFDQIEDINVSAEKETEKELLKEVFEDNKINDETQAYLLESSEKVSSKKEEKLTVVSQKDSEEKVEPVPRNSNLNEIKKNIDQEIEKSMENVEPRCIKNKNSVNNDIPIRNKSNEINLQTLMKKKQIYSNVLDYNDELVNFDHQNFINNEKKLRNESQNTKSDEKEEEEKPNVVIQESEESQNKEEPIDVSIEKEESKQEEKSVKVDEPETSNKSVEEKEKLVQTPKKASQKNIGIQTERENKGELKNDESQPDIKPLNLETSSPGESEEKINSSYVDQEYTVEGKLDIKKFMKSNPDLLEYMIETTTNVFFNIGVSMKNTNSPFKSNLNEGVVAIKIINKLLGEDLIVSKGVVNSYIEKLFYLIYSFKKDTKKNSLKTSLKSNLETENKIELQDQLIGLYKEVVGVNYEVQNKIETMLCKALMNKMEIDHALKEILVNTLIEQDKYFEEFLVNRYQAQFGLFLAGLADKKIYCGNYINNLIQYYLKRDDIALDSQIEFLSNVVKLFKRTIEYNEFLFPIILSFLDKHKEKDDVKISMYKIVLDLLENIVDIEKKTFQPLAVGSDNKRDSKKIMKNRKKHLKQIFTDLIKGIVAFDVEPIKQAILLLTIYFNSIFKNFINEKDEGYKKIPDSSALLSIIALFGNPDQLVSKFELKTEFEIHKTGLLDQENISMDLIWFLVDKKKSRISKSSYNLKTGMHKEKMYDLAMKKGVKADPKILKHLKEIQEKNKKNKLMNTVEKKKERLDKTKANLYASVLKLTEIQKHNSPDFYFFYITQTEAVLLDEMFLRYDRFFKELFLYFSRKTLNEEKNFDFNAKNNSSKFIISEQLDKLRKQPNRFHARKTVLLRGNDVPTFLPNEDFKEEHEIKEPLMYGNVDNMIEDTFWLFNTIWKFTKEMECTRLFEAMPLKTFLNKLKRLNGHKVNSNYIMYDTFKGIVAQLLFMKNGCNKAISEKSKTDLIDFVLERKIGQLDWDKYLSKASNTNVEIINKANEGLFNPNSVKQVSKVRIKAEDDEAKEKEDKPDTEDEKPEIKEESKKQSTNVEEGEKKTIFLKDFSRLNGLTRAQLIAREIIEDTILKAAECNGNLYTIQKSFIIEKTVKLKKIMKERQKIQNDVLKAKEKERTAQEKKEKASLEKFKARGKELKETLKDKPKKENDKELIETQKREKIILKKIKTTKPHRKLKKINKLYRQKKAKENRRKKKKKIEKRPKDKSIIYSYKKQKPETKNYEEEVVKFTKDKSTLALNDKVINQLKTNKKNEEAMLVTFKKAVETVKSSTQFNEFLSVYIENFGKVFNHYVGLGFEDKAIKDINYLKAKNLIQMLRDFKIIPLLNSSKVMINHAVRFFKTRNDSTKNFDFKQFIEFFIEFIVISRDRLFKLYDKKEAEIEDFINVTKQIFGNRLKTKKIKETSFEGIIEEFSKMKGYKLKEDVWEDIEQKENSHQENDGLYDLMSKTINNKSFIPKDLKNNENEDKEVSEKKEDGEETKEVINDEKQEEQPIEGESTDLSDDKINKILNYIKFRIKLAPGFNKVPEIIEMNKQTINTPNNLFETSRLGIELKAKEE